MDQEFILISHDDDGKIDGAVFFRAPSNDGYKAGSSRALIAGAKQFQVYRLQKDSDGNLTFSRVEKNSGKASG